MSDQFDGFSIYLAEDEDGDFLAHFIEMPQVSAFANTPVSHPSRRTVLWAHASASRCNENPRPEFRPARRRNPNSFYLLSTAG